MVESSAHIRIYTFGTLSVERKRSDGGTWEAIASSAWGQATYGKHTKSLLSYLLCCPQRHAFRGRITDDLWESDLASIDDYMQRATSQLRQLLDGEPYFTQTVNRTKYTLANQSLLWVDVDHCKTVLEEAKRVGITTLAGLALLQEADYYFRRGRFLEEETGMWIHSRRSTIHTLATDCFHWLLNAYEAQGQEKPREDLAEYLLREEPLNDNALCHLMTALHNRGMTSEALRRYRETATLAKKTGNVLFIEAQTLASRLQSELQISMMKSTFTIPSYLHNTNLEETEAFPSILSINMQDTIEKRSNSSSNISLDELLERFSKVLLKRTNIDRVTLKQLDAQTEKYWQDHNKGIITSNHLLSEATKFLQAVLALLEGSLIPSARMQLCEIISRIALLIGALLFDGGYYGKARAFQKFALQAAQEGLNYTWQASAWGLLGLAWAYDNEPYQALACIQQGRSIAIVPASMTVHSWLAAIEAEIQAKLRHTDACLRALEDAILPTSSGEDSYWTGYDSIRMEGFRGACLKLLYNPKKAETKAYLEDAQKALLKALAQANVATHEISSIYLCDLASTYILQKEVEGACILAGKALVANGRQSQMIIQRVLALRKDLYLWKNTEYVDQLDKQLLTLNLSL